MSALRLLIWDFDGTLAHRRGETGWSILLAETLDVEEPGHGHSPDTFRPHLREGFPWHRPEVAHPELCEPEAWWASVRPVLGRAYEATGYEKPHAQAFASVLDSSRPVEAWMVGDNVVADVLGAEAVGIPAVLVRRPDPRAARYAESLAGVERFVGEAVAA